MFASHVFKVGICPTVPVLTVRNCMNLKLNQQQDQDTMAAIKVPCNINAMKVMV